MYASGETAQNGLEVDLIRKGQYQIIFISPELLLVNLTWRDMIRTHTYMSNLVAFVVDEAHCVTKW